MKILEKMPRSPSLSIVLLGAVFLLTGFSLAGLMKSLHFSGPEYEFLRVPFFNDFFDSIIGAIYRKQRIGLELFLVVISKTFGFNKIVFFLVEVFLHAISSVTFGLCLLRAFPQRPFFAAAAAMLAFAMPMSTAMTYYTPTSPLSSLLVWLSIYLLQSWAKRNASAFVLAASCVPYVLSYTVYENAVLFVFAAPFFVLPILADRCTGKPDEQFTSSLIKLGVAILLAFLAVLELRYGLHLGGGGSAIRGLPGIDVITASLWTTGGYLIAPFREFSLDWPALAFGTAFATLSGGLLLNLPHRADNTASGINQFLQSGWAILGLGATLFVLGITPYLMAGQFSEVVAWRQGARVFSSGGYGIAVLIALIPTIFKNRLFRTFFRVGMLIIAGVWITFWFSLRHDWKTATDIYCGMWSDLMEQVPYVTGNTTFLFTDLSHSIGNADVFGSSDGLMVLMQMLYTTPEIMGREHIYAYNIELNSRDNNAFSTATGEGLTTPLSSLFLDRPIPLDSLVLVIRNGRRLIVTDKITASSGIHAINWQGVSELRTNFNRILPAPAGAPSVEERLKRVGARCPRKPDNEKSYSSSSGLPVQPHRG